MGQIWEMVILEPFELVKVRAQGNLVTLVNVRCWYPPFSNTVVMLSKATGSLRIGPQFYCGYTTPE